MYFACSIDYYTRRGTYGYTARGILQSDNEEAALEKLWTKKEPTMPAIRASAPWIWSPNL